MERQAKDAATSADERRKYVIQLLSMREVSVEKKTKNEMRIQAIQQRIAKSKQKRNANTKPPIKHDMELTKQQQLLMEQDLKEKQRKEKIEITHEKHLLLLDQREEKRGCWARRYRQVLEAQTQQVEEKWQQLEAANLQQAQKQRTEQLNAITLSMRMAREQKGQRMRTYARRIQTQRLDLEEQKLHPQKLNKKQHLKREDACACAERHADASELKCLRLSFTKNMRFSTNVACALNASKMRWRLHLQRKSQRKIPIYEDSDDDILRLLQFLYKLYATKRYARIGIV